MSLKNINKTSGFTIVELLIVVVVIAILAAITIVTYTGITQQANASSAKGNASNLVKKIEAYVSDESKTAYPLTIAALTTSTDSNKPFYVPSGTYNVVADFSTDANKKTNSVTYTACANTGTPSATNINGVRIGYWSYTNLSGTSAPGVAYISAGDTSGCS